MFDVRNMKLPRKKIAVLVIFGLVFGLALYFFAFDNFLFPNQPEVAGSEDYQRMATAVENTSFSPGRAMGAPSRPLGSRVKLMVQPVNAGKAPFRPGSI